MEPKPGDHGMRQARQEAVSGDTSVATALAGWRLKPKAEYEVELPKLKDEPALTTEEERISAIETALREAVEHMYAAEARKAPAVVGMKTYSIAIMAEALGLTPTDIAQDAGALSDLVEYLTDKVRVTEGIDMRSSTFEASAVNSPDVKLIEKIRGTWDLPDNEFQFGGPNMYRRVDWSWTDPSAGN